MGFDFISQVDPDFSTPEQYFADYARQRTLWRADKGGFDTEEDDEGVVILVEREKVEKGRTTTILEEKVRVEPKNLGTSPKGLATALASMGWEVSCWKTVVDVSPVLYVADAKANAAVQYSAGDVRFEGYVGRQYAVEARFGEHPVAIQAFYLGKGLLNAKGLPSNTGSFEWARLRDSAYGFGVDNFVDYTRSKKDAEELGWSEEKRIQIGMMLNRRYNDGGTIQRVHKIHYKEADPVNNWVDFYLDLLKIEGKRLTRAKKDPQAVDKPVDDQSMIQGAEWSG